MDKKPEKENFLKNIDLKKVNGKKFVKVTDSEKKDLKINDRVALNRKGNQFLNEGNIEVARRIFTTTKYTDGLTRVGDHYYKNNNYIEALKMYYLAPAPEKKDELIKKISSVILTWLD